MLESLEPRVLLDGSDILLFADDFDRPNSANVNASTQGQSGAAAPLSYINRNFSSISGGHLVLDGSVTIDHNFIDPALDATRPFHMSYSVRPATGNEWAGFVLGMDHATALQGGSTLKMLSPKAIGILMRGYTGQSRQFTVFLNGTQQGVTQTFDTTPTAGEWYDIDITVTPNAEQLLFTAQHTATILFRITGELNASPGPDVHEYQQSITWVNDSNHVALEAFHSGAYDDLSISRLVPAPVGRADHYFVPQRTELVVPGTSPQPLPAYELYHGHIITGNNSFSDYGRVNLRLHSPHGALLNDLEITDSVQGGDLRDMVVDSQGRIHFYDGTFDPTLTTFDPATGQFSQRTFPGWSTVNNLTYGGLAILGDYVYATDMDTGSGEEELKGIIRFNLADDTAVRKEADGPIDVAIGLDGLLYSLHPGDAWNGNAMSIEVFDPYTLDSIRRFDLGASVRAIAIDAQGGIYGVGDGAIMKFNPDGAVLRHRPLGVGGLADVDIDPTGMIVIASHGGEMLVTNLHLDEPVYFDSGEAIVNFAAIVPGTLPLRGVLANDSDIQDLSLTPALVAGPQHAAAFEFLPDGGFNYTPLDDFHGVDTFTYLVSNGAKESELVTVSITVQYVNRASVAANDFYAIAPDTTLSAGPTDFTALLHTGFNEATGVKLIHNELDTDWIFAPGSVEGAGNHPYVFRTGVHSGYLADAASDHSAWLRLRGQGQGNELAGNYIFERTIQLTAEQAATARFDSLRLAVDNQITSITLNGISIFPLADESIIGFGQFVSLTNRGQGLFVEGANTLRITVLNGGGGPNPSALRFEGNVVSDDHGVDRPPGVLANDLDPDPVDTLTARVDAGPQNGFLTFAADGSFRYIPNPGFVGIDTFTYIVTDGLIDSEPVTVTISTQEQPAPRVVSVGVAASGWNPAFIALLDATDAAGDGAFTIPAGAAQLHALPWSNLNQVTLRFDQAVNISQNHLAVAGVNDLVLATTGFAYNPANFTATWSLAGSLNAERLLLTLADTVTAAVSGIALDGEWLDALSSQSGDGAPGGDFHFRFNVLAGDVDASGLVDEVDMNLVRDQQFKAAGDPDYLARYDTNGSGLILADDVILTRNRQTATLPAGQPVPTAATVVEPDEATAIRLTTAGLAAVALRPAMARALAAGQLRQGSVLQSAMAQFMMPPSGISPPLMASRHWALSSMPAWSAVMLERVDGVPVRVDPAGPSTVMELPARWRYIQVDKG